MYDGPAPFWCSGPRASLTRPTSTLFGMQRSKRKVEKLEGDLDEEMRRVRRRTSELDAARLVSGFVTAAASAAQTSLFQPLPKAKGQNTAKAACEIVLLLGQQSSFSKDFQRG
jgi:hypothetical protein